MTETAPWRVRGIRGATTVDRNTPQAIAAATSELLEEMIGRNDVRPADVASACFTTTQDLDAEFPAVTARNGLGWTHVALLCGHEMHVPGSLPRCLRILLHVNTQRTQRQIQHIYLRGATVLRPDVAGDPDTPTPPGHRAKSRTPMLVVMRTDATEEEIRAVLERLKEANLQGHLSAGEERTVIGAVGRVVDPEIRTAMGTMAGVDSVVPISRPYKLAGREFKPRDTVIDVGGVRIGDGHVTVMAGPCSIENEDHVLRTARAVHAAGGHILRGGAYKPRTSPYSFRGLGEDGLRHLATARQETGLPVITEVMSIDTVEIVARYADILQIGARNMQNFNLLDEVGLVRKPAMLKRGLSGTIEEWLLAAEYIMAKGNHEVILCERGIRTFETATRNTLDLAGLALVKRMSHLPVISDPSHGTGRWHLVGPMAKASVAVGADGLMIEVHPSPDHALSDGAQSLTFENFTTLMQELAPVGRAVDRPLAPAPGERARAPV